MNRFRTAAFSLAVLAVIVTIVTILVLEFNRLEAKIAALELSAASRLNEMEALLEAMEQRPFTLHAALRPDDAGRWFIQNDVDHKPYGIDTYLEQTPDSIKIFTCCGAPRGFAGTIQISSDDQFGSTITGHANLGIGGATIEVRADGRKIDPAEIWNYLPRGGGNFWISITMLPATPSDTL